MSTMASNARAKAPAEPAGGLKGFVTKNQKWISLAMRLFLAAMWINYSIGKLGSPDQNVQNVRDFKILPESLVTPFGYAQPWIELAFGVLLILGLGTRVIAAFSALLLLTYVGGIISLGARGIAINCGCGGVGGVVAKGHTRYTLDVIRDVVFMIPAAWLLWKPDSKFSLDEVVLGEPIED
jgi:uncharacterized membrane protein YphA (DoxX/SURF4 family)